MALKLPQPVHLAAIDAGSNAFRLIIARVDSAEHWEVVESLRAPVRLGHSAFAQGKFDRKTLHDATAAFELFRRAMDRHAVVAYRAVATSAAREASNRHLLIDRVLHQAKIHLEVISGDEEARLVRLASLRALRNMNPPRFILDLGGGSLEINELRDGNLLGSVGLPLGTVRLMEMFGVQGPIQERKEEDLRGHILSVLHGAILHRPKTGDALAVACGGNAETLSLLAAGPRIGGQQTLNPALLQDRLWQILRLDVEGRMKAFSVRRDRAEVMGVAALVLVTVARWLRLRAMITPRVGVREGLLHELATAQMTLPAPTLEERNHQQVVTAGAESFATRVRCDLKHGDQVRLIALQLFDQLWPYHCMNFELRTILEAASTLHDSGHLVNRKAHHRHGEYLVRNGKIQGLRGWAKSMVASLVRYHNGKSEPRIAHKPYASLDPEHRKMIRILTGMLQLAERLESDHKQAISGLAAEGGPNEIRIHVELKEGTRFNLTGIERKARLLERELRLRLRFQRVVYVEKAKVA